MYYLPQKFQIKVNKPDLSQELLRIQQILNVWNLLYCSRKSKKNIFHLSNNINVHFDSIKKEKKLSKYFLKAKYIYHSEINNILSNIQSKCDDKDFFEIKNQVEEHIASIKYNHKLLKKIEKELKKIKGLQFQTDILYRIAYASDSSDLHFNYPLSVIFPTKHEQIIDLMEIAKKYKLTLLPRGAGVGYTGGCVPLDDKTIVVCTEAMNKIEEIKFDEKENASIWAQAGAITDEVDQAANAKGYFLAVDPVSKKTSTIGGNLAEGAGGPRCFEYGAALDNVLAYKFIDPSGRFYLVERISPLPIQGRLRVDQNLEFKIFDIKSKKNIGNINISGKEIRKPGLAKDVMNKYLHGLYGVQKEGIDGVITDICFALHKLPKHIKSFFLSSDDFEEGHKVITALIKFRESIPSNQLRILRLEHWDKTCAAVTSQKDNPESSFAIELASESEALIEEASKLLKSLEGEDAKFYKDPDFSPWKYRQEVKGISAKTGVKLNEDICINTNLWPKFNDYVFELQKKYRKKWNEIKDKNREKHQNDEVFKNSDFIIAFFGHYGDGNAHFTIPIYLQYRQMLDLAEECVEELFAKILQSRKEGGFEGSITGEHGIGLAKLKFLKKLSTKKNVQAQEQLDSIKKFQDIHCRKIDRDQIWHQGLNIDSADKTFTIDIRQAISLLQNEIDENSTNQSKSILDQQVINQIINIAESIKGCIRCGACKHVCHEHNPSERLFLSPYYKNSFIRIFLSILSQHLLACPYSSLPRALWQSIEEVVKACSMCSFCLDECPADIDTGKVVMELKTLIALLEEKNHQLLPCTNKELAAYFLSLDKSKQAAQFSINSCNAFKKVIPQKLRSHIPLKIEKSIHPSKYSSMKEFVYIESNNANSESVFLWQGCGELMGKTALANIFLLNKAGFNVLILKNNPCCSFPYFFQKNKINQNLKKKNHKLFEKITEFDLFKNKEIPLIVNCPSCKHGLNQNILKINNMDFIITDLLESVFSSFSDQQINKIKTNLKSKKIFYQKPCHLDKKLFTKYKDIFAKLDLDPSYNQFCCGSVGAMNNGSKKFMERINNIKCKVSENSISTSNCTICTGSMEIATSKEKNIETENLSVLITNCFDLNWIEEMKAIICRNSE